LNLTYKRATIEDIDILTETRIEVLRAANKLSDDIKNHWTEIALSSGYGSIFIRNGTYYYNGTYIKYNHYNGAVFLIDSVGGLHIWRIVSGVHSMKSTNF